MDRSSIVRAANDGGNWRQLAEQLGVNHKTAYTWIREGRDEAKQKGGRRRKCTNEQIDVLVAMIGLQIRAGFYLTIASTSDRFQ